MNWKQLNEHQSYFRNQCFEAYFDKTSIYFSLSYYYLYQRYKMDSELTVEELLLIFEKNGVQCSPHYAKKALNRFDSVMACIRIGRGSIHVLNREYGLNYDIVEFLNDNIAMTEEEFLNSYDYKRNLAWLANRENIIVSEFLCNGNSLYYLECMSKEELCESFLGISKSRYWYRQIKLSARAVANLGKVLKSCLADIKMVEDSYDYNTKKSSVDATFLISKYGLDYVFVDMLFLHEHRYPC